MSITDLSASQLRQAADLKDQIEVLHKELAAVGTGWEISITLPASAPDKKRKFSAAGLARLRAAQKARWAKVKTGKPGKPEKKIRKKMSKAGRAKIAAAAKARWAKDRAAKTA